MTGEPPVLRDRALDRLLLGLALLAMLLGAIVGFNVGVRVASAPVAASGRGLVAAPVSTRGACGHAEPSGLLVMQPTRWRS